MSHKDWNERDIELAQSVGGVYACSNAWDGLVRGGVTPWPPPELVQKLYQSRQVRAYKDDHRTTVERHHGFYSDLQSVHSEDAVTWSLMGPLAYASREVRAVYVADLLRNVTRSPTSATAAHIWLWRRLPHPDTLVPGGPEIDFGIQTDHTVVLGEAKWRSAVAGGQGAERNKDQIKLRVEFCEKYGAKIFPGVSKFIVMLVSRSHGSLTAAQSNLGSDRVSVIESTWKELGSMDSHPYKTEFLAHHEWRMSLSKTD